MKTSNIISIVLIVLFAIGSSFAQVRYGQVEINGGVGLLMKPDDMKDYFKTGFNVKGQYVTFMSPTLGLTFGVGYSQFGLNEDKFEEDLRDELEYYMGYYDYDISFDNIDVKGNFNNLELSIGIRPYLTRPEASNQFFVFGEAVYNIMKIKVKTDYSATVTYYDPYYGYYEQTVDGDEEIEADDEKFGLIAGAGFEMPFGANSKLSIKGAYNLIFFSKDDDKIANENLSYFTITAGIAF